MTIFKYCDLFSDTCGRHVKFTTEKDGYSLQGHVIKNLSLQLGTRDPCRGQCVMESRCVSINIGPPINDRVICELSDSDDILHPEDLKPRTGFTYTGIEVKNLVSKQHITSVTRAMKVLRKFGYSVQFGTKIAYYNDKDQDRSQTSRQDEASFECLKREKLGGSRGMPAQKNLKSSGSEMLFQLKHFPGIFPIFSEDYFLN